jgi:hypothetical protein
MINIFFYLDKERENIWSISIFLIDVENYLFDTRVIKSFIYFSDMKWKKKE